eukprot:9495064-Pyramimonas_sp.AAC.2
MVHFTQKCEQAISGGRLTKYVPPPRARLAPASSIYPFLACDWLPLQVYIPSSRASRPSEAAALPSIYPFPMCDWLPLQVPRAAGGAAGGVHRLRHRRAQGETAATKPLLNLTKPY